MSTNPLSNQSYINKDFQTIYPELLDAVKKITYKWDPTISNESDPGVILLKLNAIIADKNNYNIDKNVLECFPDTVSQYGNAYKLYAQLGYKMHWYKGATGELNMAYKNNEFDSATTPDPIQYYVPPFAMFCDSEKEVIFTATEHLFISEDPSVITQQVPVIQGVIRDLRIGSSNIITFSNLDENRRIYFPVENVAQNGIFISNAKKNPQTGLDDLTYDETERWTQVDNLHVQALNTKVYEFGIDQVTNSCYIEFPLDISSLIQDGIVIKYIQTDGLSGNTTTNKINTCYASFKGYPSNSSGERTSGDPVDFDTDKLSVINYAAMVNGTDKETIDEAYVNYQKTIGTFDTLVTLRDYINYITRDEFEVISNGVVSDRTNDIQDSYNIITDKVGIDELLPKVTKDEDDKDLMAAFDLKTYFFDYSKFDTSADQNILEQIQSLKAAYEKSFTFKMGNDGDPLGTDNNVKTFYENTKCIQHDFIAKEVERPLLIKNVFDLNITVIPTNLISQREANEIRKNVLAALLTRFQSKNLTFGNEITYEEVYDVCTLADSRIKAIALDNFTYNPKLMVYGEYTDNQEELQTGIYEVDLTPINHTIISTVDNGGNISEESEYQLEFLAKNILNGTTALFKQASDFSFQLAQSGAQVTDPVDKITTYCEFDFTGDTQQQEVLPNESICFFSPNLISESQFSIGCKYIYTNDTDKNKVLQANSDTMLANGDHLWLFWTEEDGADALYLYKEFSDGDILNPSFKVEQDQSTSLDSVIQNLKAKFTGEGKIFGTLNDELRALGGSEHTLSTSRTLTSKRVNQVELNQPNNLAYWITNNKTENNEYKLGPFSPVQTKSYVEYARYESGHSTDSNYANPAWIANYNGYPTINNDHKNIVVQVTNAAYRELVNNRPVDKTTRSFQYLKLLTANSNDIISGASSAVNFISENEIGYRTTKVFDADPSTQQVVAAGVQVSEVETDKITFAQLSLSGCQIPSTENIAIDQVYDTAGSGSIVPAAQYTLDNENGYITFTGLDSHTLNITYHYTGDGNGSQYIFIPNVLLKQFAINETTNYTPMSLVYYDGREGSLLPSRVPINTNDDIDIYESGVNGSASHCFGSRVKLPSSAGTLDDTADCVFDIVLGFGALESFSAATNNNIPYGKFARTSSSGTTDTYNLARNADAMCIDDYISANEQSVMLMSGNYLSLSQLATSEDVKYDEYQYILKNNEYFFYTDVNRASYNMLSSGGLIKITLQKDKTIDSIENLLVVDVVDTDQYLQDGISTLPTDKWRNFQFNQTEYEKDQPGDFGVLLTCVVNEQVFMGESTLVKITPISESVPYRPIITSNGTVVNDGSVENTTISNPFEWSLIQYLAPGATQWESLDTKAPYLAWNAYSVLNINTSSSNPQILTSTHKDTFSWGTNNFIPPEGTTGNYEYYVQSDIDVTLSGGQDVDVRYQKIEDTEGTLHGIKLLYYQNELNKSAVEALSTTSEVETDGDNFVLNLANVQITLDRIISMTNITDDSSDVPLTWVESVSYDDSTSATTILFNSDAELQEQDTIQVSYEVDSPYVVISNPDLSNNITIDFTIPTNPLSSLTKYGDITYSFMNVGEHHKTILPISLSRDIVGDSGEVFSISSIDGTSASTMFPIGYSQDNMIYVGKKMYYFILEPSGGTLRFTATYASNVSIRLHPLFTCEYAFENVPEEQQTDWNTYKKDSYLYVPDYLLLGKIQEYDIDHEFNYVYVPDKNTSIDNPLYPPNYFNSNNKYNRYTIPKIKKIDVKVVNVK